MNQELLNLNTLDKFCPQMKRLLDTIEEKTQMHRKRIKEMFDKNIKESIFSCGDMLLRWDSIKEQKGKHGKFDNLWFGPFIISKILENNTFILQTMEG